jgi:two-component system, cell cycle sensor histidine kinase and response regulator CckA
MTAATQGDRPLADDDNEGNLFDAVFRSARDALLLADDQARYVEANPAACELLGRSRDELLTMSVFDVSPTDVDTDAMWRAFLERGEMGGEYVVVRPDGSTVDVEFRATANIRPGIHLSIMRDVTERVVMEQQLERARRLESLGLLAAGVAHDFNTVMATIRGHAELLRSDLEPQAHDSLAAIDSAVERAIEVTNRLLAFGREQDLERRVIHVNEIVDHVRPLVEPLVGPKVNLVIDLTDERDAHVAVDAQIEQVVLQLVGNARDAMPDGGRLVISTSTRQVGSTRPAPEITPGRYAVLEVADTGMGMDEETKDRAFDPFFTTKSSWSPSGLGLTSAYGLVTQMGGAIRIGTAPGRGTTVTLLLPTTEGTH